MQIIDTHAHLESEPLREIVPEVLQRAKAAGLVGIIAVGTDVKSSRRCVELAQSNPMIWAAVGIHPNYCHQAGIQDWAEIEQLSREDRVVALGETGLDKYWDDCPWDAQLDYFRRHWELSRRTNLPCIIHMRDCETEMLAEIDHQYETADAPLRGVLHSFTGSAASSQRFVECGLYISFAGMVTYKKSDLLRSVAAQVPGDRLLVETDCPYLSPEPFRNRRPNEPALVVHTLQVVAKARGELTSALATQTTQNAYRLFDRMNIAE